MLASHRHRLRPLIGRRRRASREPLGSWCLTVVIVLLAGCLGLTELAYAAPNISAGGVTSLVLSSATSARASSHGYLLALGDSLAAGYQPPDRSSLPPIDPSTGFPDKGYPGGYASDLAAVRGLNLIDLGCPGETTISMLQKPAQAACASDYEAEFSASSQLAAALSFLSGHKGQVRLVSIDLGANDIERCATNGALDPSCLHNGAASARHNLPVILSKLKHALDLDDPGARLLAMNYYDPFLGLAFRPGGEKASGEAVLSLALVDSYNEELQAVYQRANVPVAKVAAAFGSGSAIPLTSYGGRQLPRNVALVCRWTWMCPISPAKDSPDIHANSAGYRQIAGAFLTLLAKS